MSFKNFPGVTPTELGPRPASESVSVVGATGGGGLPVAATIIAPLGPQTEAASVAVVVNNAALPLPAGASTAAKQDDQTALLTTIDADTGNIATSTASIDSKTPTVGQKLMAASSPVVIASDQSAVPISAASLPLPAGAATEAKQDDQLAQLISIDSSTSNIAIDVDSINGKITTVNTDAVTVVASALPTGAATEASLAKLTLAQGSTTSGESGPLAQGAVTTAAPTYLTGQTNPLSLTTAGALRTDSSGSTQPVSGTVTVTQATGTNLHAVIDSGTIAATQSGTWNINNVSGTVSLPTGASTETTLAALNTKTPAGAYVTSVRNDYTSVNVTTGAWVQLVASLGATVNQLDIFDSSGQTLELGVGAAAAETRTLLIYPGGNGQVRLTIAAGTRVSIRAVSIATVNTGELDINFLS